MDTVATAEARLTPPSLAAAIEAGEHGIVADEPAAHGGGNTGPTPMELVLGGLASCTAMTIAMYTNRKKWPLERVRAEAKGQRRSDSPGPYDRIELDVHL